MSRADSPVRPRKSPRIAVEPLEPRETPALFAVNPAQSFSGLKNNGHVVVADLDADGNPDIVLTNYGTTSPKAVPADPGQKLSVLLGRGDGTFDAPTHLTVGADQHVSFVAVGDVDGDGDPDLVCVSTGAGEVGKLTVFLGNGAGGFTKHAQVDTGGSNSAWVGLARLTPDDDLDVVVCSFGEGDEGTSTVTGNNVTVFQGDGAGNFDRIQTVGGPLAFLPTSGAVADFDGDGLLDLAVTVPGVPPSSTDPQPAGTVEVFRGTAGGGFDPDSAASYDSGGPLPIGVAAADLDGDGRPDLVVANAGDPDVNGLYADFGAGSAVGVLLNAGDGSFGGTDRLLAGTTAGGSKSVFAVAVGDFDADGDPDIAAVTYGHPIAGTPARVPVFLGDGAGGFGAVADGSPFDTGTTDGQYLAVGAFDANATPDLVVVGAANRVVTLLNQTDPGEPTATALETSAASNPYGTGFTLRATVTAAAGVPTGTVTFLNGAAVLGAATLADVGGQPVATLDVAGTALNAGTHTLTARYEGAAGFAGGTSPGVSQTVTPVAPAVALSAPAAAAAGELITFTATVSSPHGAPGGSVGFFEGTTLIGGPVALANVGGQQRAAFMTTLAAGTHAVTARYLGAGNFAAADSAAVTVTVTPTAPPPAPAATTTTLSSSANPSAVGQPVTFTAVVAAAAGVPTGTVSLYDGATLVGGPSPLETVGTRRVATFVLTGLSLGTHNLAAAYGGAAGFQPSESDVLVQRVDPAATTTTVTVGPSPAVYGQPVTFTAVVAAAAGVPAGLVQFFVGGTPVGTAVPLGSAFGRQQAAVPVAGTALPAGDHAVTARFLGGGEFAASDSAPAAHRVDPATPAVAVSGGGSSPAGAAVTFTVEVTSAAGTPAGGVTLFDGAAAIAGPVELAVVGGRPRATFVVTDLAPGTHAITARYAGAGNFGPATSGAVAHLVARAGVTLGLSATPNPSAVGQTVRLTATVADAAGIAADPTGAVTFRAGGLVLGTVPLAGGAAALDTAALPPGSPTVTAEYGGDGNFVPGSVSAGLTVTPGGSGGSGGGGGGDGGGGGGQPPATPRPVLVGYREFGVGAGDGQPAVGRFFNPDGSERFSLDLFPGFAGGVRVTSADFNGDGVADLVAGTGPGAVTRVRIVDGRTRAILFDTQPFEDTFTRGVFVAAGDVTGDGVPDLVVSPDEGGGPRVQVYDGRRLSEFPARGKFADFFAITGDPNFRGGVRVGVGDVDGDGFGDLVVSAGFGGGPRVAGFGGARVAAGDVGETAKLFRDFFVFDPSLRNGAYVTAGDLDGDGRADLVAGAGPGGGPRVFVLDAVGVLAGQGENARPLANFFAGNPDNRGGVRVAVRNLDGDARADLVVGDGDGAGSHVTTYRGAAVTAPDLSFDAFPGAMSGVFVG
jgi:hypothetical protein